jgi:acyl-coenzyme A thioesterase PaaI-like protein
MPGAAHLRLRPVEVTPALRERRRAVAELGDALRELVDAAVRTESDAAVLRTVAAELRPLVTALRERARRRTQIPVTDDLVSGVRMYSPAYGRGNPLAPPMAVEYLPDRVVGRCTLGLAYEGPHMFCHGGVSALLLDQILGHAVAAIRAPGVTVELRTRYRRPVPLETPLVVTGRAARDDGMVIRATGVLTTADDPDTPLVEADARFVTLRPDQAARIFADTERPTTITPDEAHD